MELVDYIYLGCASVGGTILAIQFFMMILGLGGDAAGFDGDLDVSDGVDFSGNSISVVDHGSTFLFSVISFKTIVAAMTFFGLAGLATSAEGISPLMGFVISLVAGGAAMFIVHGLMQAMYKLNANGAIRIQRSLGQSGTVYIPIPGNHSGEGKIQLRLQNRIVELRAVTSHAELLSVGAKVVVSKLVTPLTVQVELLGTQNVDSEGSRSQDINENTA